LLKSLLWRPHVGQLLVFFSLAVVLFASAVLLLFVPQTRQLSARVKVLEAITFEILVKNQETALALLGRIERTATRLEADVDRVSAELQTTREASEAACERKYKELKEFMERSPAR
jgi:hypothetical protein